MPQVSYGYFDGIEGSCEQEGREKSVEIYALDHTVEVPVHKDDATATGTRIHRGMDIVCKLDKATPLLQEKVCTSGTVKEVKIELWMIDLEGTETNYFNIKMTNVRIVSSRIWYPNTSDAATENYKHMVTYTLRYDKIEWECTDGNLSFADEWKKPHK